MKEMKDKEKRRKTKEQKLRDTILKVSEGVFEKLVDLVLVSCFFTIGMAVSSRGSISSSETIARELLDQINYQTIKNALWYGRRKGWIKKSGQGRKINPEITAEGKRRLEAILPHYDKKRVWDKRVYLITYDIPETKRKERDLLREYLRRIGCGMFQRSVWITPYNPKEVLKKFIKERYLKGSVIISDVGSDGSIGDEDLRTLVVKVYNLEELNKRYQNFLEKYRKREDFSIQTLFSFWSILQDDPQLPFELLPGDWLGKQAYRVFLRARKKLRA